MRNEKEVSKGILVALAVIVVALAIITLTYYAVYGITHWGIYR